MFSAVRGDFRVSPRTLESPRTSLNGHFSRFGAYIFGNNLQKGLLGTFTWGFFPLRGKQCTVCPESQNLEKTSYLKNEKCSRLKWPLVWKLMRWQFNWNQNNSKFLKFWGSGTKFRFFPILGLKGPKRPYLTIRWHKSFKNCLLLRPND